MGIEVLGPLTIEGGQVQGMRDRVVLETLVINAGEVVDKEVLADALWGDDLPPTWRKAVQGCIARLRKLLPTDAITTTPYGYRLLLRDDQLDSRRFERMLARARDHLADLDSDRAAYVLSEALGLWRGKALPDLVEWEGGRVEAERLEELRLDAQELVVEAEIEAGRSRAVLEVARTRVKEAPLREHRWALFARALYQAGRQTEALDVIGRARRMLRDELGLDPGPELHDLQEAILRQDAALSGSQPLETSSTCPYRGLLPYEAVDAEAFFGRDADIAACLDKLQDNGVLTVVGPSGTGKSSLVRAGVAASLEQNGTKVLVTTPGLRPLDSLVRLPSRRPYPVLVVDQAEEAVTLCTDPVERAAYFHDLDAYAGPLVVALRADRLGDLSAYPDFARVVERGFYLLTAMSEDNLRAAIEGPARHAGLRLEHGLVDLLVREVEGEPGALPLVSHVLRQTWELREGPTLTVDGYRATGGIRNAVAQSAEGLYEQLDDRQRSQMRDLFLRLVMPSDDGDAVRARIPRKNLALDAAHEQLVATLVDARLVSSDQGDVQIAHEALARAWPRLRGWLEEDVEGQRIFRHLAAGAEAWDTMGRPQSELYRGVRLAGASDWADRAQVELTDTERQFLGASYTQAESERGQAQERLAEQEQSNQRLRSALGRFRVALAGAVVLLVVALVAGLLAIEAARDSRDAAEVADSRRLASQALLADAPDVALLLATESVHLDDSSDTRSALYTVLGKNSQLLGTARGTADGFTAIAVSPDGRTVTTGDSAGLTVRDAETLDELVAVDDAPVADLTVSSDGRLLAYSVDAMRLPTPSPDPVRVVAAGSLEPAFELGGTPRSTWVNDGVRFSEDGSRLAAPLRTWGGSVGNSVLVWDLSRPDRPVAQIPYDGVRANLALNRSGDVVYLRTRGPDVLRSYDVMSGRLIASEPAPALSEREPPLTLSPNGRLLATSHENGVAVFDVETLRLLYVLPGLTDDIASLAFSPDGTTLASGFTSGTTVVWDLSSKEPRTTLRGHTQAVEAVAFRPDGEAIYTVGGDGQILARDVSGAVTFPPSQVFPENPPAGGYAYPSPDGRTIAYISYPHDRSKRLLFPLQFRDVGSGRLTAEQPLDLNFPSFWETAWTPDSREFVVLGGARPGEAHSRHMYQTWDPASGKPTYTDYEAGIDAAYFMSDGKRVVTIEADPGTVTVRDRATREPLSEPVVVGRWGYGEATLSPDEQTLYVPLEPDEDSGESTGYTAVVDLAAGEARRVSADTIPHSISFSPDGSKVALYGSDGSWGILATMNLGSSNPEWLVGRRQYSGAKEFYSMKWSADSSHVLSVGPGSIDLWDSSDLAHLGSLPVGDADQVADLYIPPEGHWFMAMHPGGAIFSWNLRRDYVLEVACKAAGRSLTRAEWSDFVGERTYHETCPT